VQVKVVFLTSVASKPYVIFHILAA